MRKLGMLENVLGAIWRDDRLVSCEGEHDCEPAISAGTYNEHLYEAPLIYHGHGCYDDHIPILSSIPGQEQAASRFGFVRQSSAD